MPEHRDKPPIGATQPPDLAGEEPVELDLEELAEARDLEAVVLSGTSLDDAKLRGLRLTDVRG